MQLTDVEVVSEGRLHSDWNLCSATFADIRLTDICFDQVFYRSVSAVKSARNVSKKDSNTLRVHL